MVRAIKSALFLGLAIVGCVSMAQPSYAQAQGDAQLRTALPGVASSAEITPEKVRKTRWLAYRLAKYRFLEKVVEADPRIVAAICAHPGPAKILAKHLHLDRIAEQDHYLCRRLCRWKGATDKLVRNPHFQEVVELDPAGMYFAMNRNPVYARVLARQNMFWDLTNSDRNMVAEMRKHMK